MYIRLHRGSLEKSMQTCVECQDNDEIRTYLTDHGYDPTSVRCEVYDLSPDTRIDWPATYVVLNEAGVVGFASDLFDLSNPEDMKATKQ